MEDFFGYKVELQDHGSSKDNGSRDPNQQKFRREPESLGYGGGSRTTSTPESGYQGPEREPKCGGLWIANTLTKIWLGPDLWGRGRGNTRTLENRDPDIKSLILGVGVMDHL